jgi:hypothetical protein
VDIEPFHALGGQPSDAIVAHVVALLTAGDDPGSVRLPAPTPGEVDHYAEALARAEAEASAHFADVADHVVDVEPFQALGGDAKRAIARHIVELLARRQAEAGQDANEGGFGS